MRAHLAAAAHLIAVTEEKEEEAEEEEIGILDRPLVEYHGPTIGESWGKTGGMAHGRTNIIIDIVVFRTKENHRIGNRDREEEEEEETRRHSMFGMLIEEEDAGTTLAIEDVVAEVDPGVTHHHLIYGTVTIKRRNR
mmetsp:Transcript_21069/g.34820  ORF Transcript_21069/g.34820 Transcript_21069/m.34820 type:complete len:137 (+) Transcript_21069:1125-1535(+)